MFYSEREGVIARLPFFVTADMYEEPLTGFIHRGEDEIFVEMGPDDIFYEDLRDDMLDVNSDEDYLPDFLEKAKLAILPKAIKSILLTLGLVVALIAVFLIFRKFAFTAPFALLLLASGANTRSYLKVLDTTVLYDRRGHWVDLYTGETSLNGGWRIPRD